MGSIYALIAYGFQATDATSKANNFGQGAIAMPGAHAAARRLCLASVGLELLSRSRRRAKGR